MEQKSGSLYIGIPKESILQENRVALVPASAKTLLGRGHRIIVETDAGKESYYQDIDYSNTEPRSRTARRTCIRRM